MFDYVSPEPEESYLDVQVIVDGALNQELILPGDDAEEMLDNVVANMREHHEASGDRVEVYSTYHDHPMDANGCECMQYETDRKPYWDSGSGVFMSVSQHGRYIESGELQTDIEHVVTPKDVDASVERFIARHSREGMSYPLDEFSLVFSTEQDVLGTVQFRANGTWELEVVS